MINRGLDGQSSSSHGESRRAARFQIPKTAMEVTDDQNLQFYNRLHVDCGQHSSNQGANFQNRATCQAQSGFHSSYGSKQDGGTGTNPSGIQRRHSRLRRKSRAGAFGKTCRSPGLARRRVVSNRPLANEQSQKSCGDLSSPGLGGFVAPCTKAESSRSAKRKTTARAD